MMASLDDNVQLERSSSQISTSSKRSAAANAQPRRQSASVNDAPKTLESFPSLSPDASPEARHARLAKQASMSSTPKTPKKRAPSMVENLVERSKSAQTRTALFEDSAKGDPAEVPGALHHAHDEHIRRLIKKSGAVALVRQLASDIAERDAEITALRRRADERERELKKMLREVEVSNLDIERRLHKPETPVKKEDTATSSDKSSQLKSPNSASNSNISNITNGIDEMVGEAMKDSMTIEFDEGYLDSVSQSDKQATLKAKGATPKGSDGQSITSSSDSQAKARGTTRGWKDYLWGSSTTSRKTSKASSIASDPENTSDRESRTRGPNATYTRRKGINDDTFQPPSKASTADEGSRTPHSGKSSSAVASWTMNLFAGKPNSKRESEGQGAIEDRSKVVDGASARTTRAGSTSSVPPRSAKAALTRISSRETTRLQSKRSSLPITVNPKVGGKNGVPPVPALPSPQKAEAAANLGPVEMDTIHPENSKPPTLTQSNDKASDDFLTDRFGFIYDQRRKRKEAEAQVSHKKGKSTASTNVEMISSARASMKSPPPESTPQKQTSTSPSHAEQPSSSDMPGEEQSKNKWQDFLKVATGPAELLLHTPSPKPGINVISGDVASPRIKSSSTTSEPQISSPSLSTNAGTEISPVTAGTAEISRSSTAKPASESTSAVVEEEPVKLLLAQLTELHDNLQREKTVRWNDFLRKVRAERKKEGELAATTEGKTQQAAMPEMMLNDGEVIGVSGLGNKGKVGRAKWKEFKHLVLAGIPVAYRAKIWAECSGAAALRVPGHYDDLVRSGEDDPAVLSQIQMDIHRTLTDNIFFRKGPGVAKLNDVLLAYSRRNPEVGYCQGMNLIAASLLLIMPTAEDAFWVLTSLIENILPQHYYDPTLLASRADQQVLRSYVTEILPRLSDHLDSLGIELDALTFQWFLSVFTDCLSSEALFRVWDVIFCFNDGSTFLFQIALALLKLNESQLLDCDSAARVYGYIGNEMTDHAISIDGLINASEALKNVVKRSEVEEKRWRAVEDARSRERKSRGSTVGSANSTTGSSRELSLQEPRPVEI